LNAATYSAYVHPYGNTFPLDAFDALVQYHEAGGSIVVPSGVPFCHPCLARGAVGWAYGHLPRGGRTAEQPRTGKAAFEIYNPAGRDWTGPNSTGFTVRPGERYVVGGWVKHSEEFVPHPNSCIFLRFFDTQGRFIGQDGPRIPDEPCEWVRVQKEVVVPEGAATADVSPQLWAPDARLFLDDLFLHRAGEETNLLPNGSFEEASGGWVDLGHDSSYLLHEGHGLGTGDFVTVPGPGGFGLTPLGRELGLGAIPWEGIDPPGLLQALAVKNLPAEDEVLPLVTAGDAADELYPAVIIAHHCRRFNGAYDLWGRGNCPTISSWAMYRITVAGTIHLLRLRGLLQDREVRTMLATLDSMLGDAGQPAMPVSEPRPYDTLWPRSTRPAETIFVCDLSKADPAEEFALTVLQGLINRRQPRLYIIHTRYDAQDIQWLEELRVEGLKTQDISAAEVWKKFGDLANGYVVYDATALGEIGAFRADRLNVTNMVLMLCA
ncbi:MAG: GxGYxYP family putative glycoside hydrolase, partial [Armatimonadetes bacterium]|nr:GxGYxYP family putative glycoside hydrolase [Armatimonadota bacterium]